MTEKLLTVTLRIKSSITYEQKVNRHDNFADVLFAQTLLNGYDVVMTFNVLAAVKYARITITHVYFINACGCRGRCLSTKPIGLVFEQLPRDPENANA